MHTPTHHGINVASLESGLIINVVLGHAHVTVVLVVELEVIKVGIFHWVVVGKRGRFGMHNIQACLYC